jgi:hypothetical protein
MRLDVHGPGDVLALVRAAEKSRDDALERAAELELRLSILQSVVDSNACMLEWMRDAARADKPAAADVDKAIADARAALPPEPTPPTERPSLEGVAWVLERVARVVDGGHGFRGMIYGELEFGPEAYLPLYLAGGMQITNALSDRSSLKATLAAIAAGEHEHPADAATAALEVLR